MSVIVKGMEMPKTCSECEWCRYDMAHPLCNRVYRRTDIETATEGRADFCPLVELPPHGDLVDRNELLAEYDRQHEGEAGKARKIMEQAKTVIEGSET